MTEGGTDPLLEAIDKPSATTSIPHAIHRLQRKRGVRQI